MKKKIIAAGASLLLCFTMFLNFNQYSTIQNVNIDLSKLLLTNNASAETWTNCTNCYSSGYYCNGNWQYMCKVGGSGCNVSGQLPC